MNKTPNIRIANDSHSRKSQIQLLRDQDITDAIDEYEALYQSITSTESRQAANALFDASSTELANTYQLGQTETQ